MLIASIAALAGCGDGGGLLEPIEKPTHEAAPVPEKAR